MRFQNLAVVLAKQKWPDLIATERHKDGGLDARAPASVADSKKAKGLASSITGTLDKVKKDAAAAKRNFPDVEILIFVTPHKITFSIAKDWAEKIQKEFGHELIVISREDIITSLMLPSNVALCGTLPGIHVPIEQDDAALLATVREAVAQEAGNWRARPRMANRPIISLNAVKLDGEGQETSETLDPDDLRASLFESRRIALEAPGGGGKTTTLVQLATENLRDGELAFLIDLPAWIRSGADVLEFIARARAFRARNISATDLARLARREHFSFLLNGWNEIAEVHSNDAVIALAELERDFPAAGIMVATRTHYISPPLPGAFRARILPFNRRQRADYLRQTLGDRANELRLQLEGSRVLDDLTRTPLILAEVVTIFQSGGPIPTTRVGVLGAVMKLIENSDEHRPHLQIAPLFNRAQHYFEKLASEMTSRGEVIIAQEDARSVIQSVTAALLARGQISTAPDPATVLHTLSAHHVLEQIDHPSIAFRFQHQQFQEFYASRFLDNALAELVQRDDEAANRAFSSSYINMPMWDEPLRMVAEEIRLRSEDGATSKTVLDTGVRLINLAIGVDPILAGGLSRLCGAAVWEAVRGDVGKILREWYAIAETHHRQLALAAMLATGADDFSDLLVPLLTDKDRQVRVLAYDAGDIFYPSSLGADWRRVVDGWDEEARTDFVFEVTHRGLLAEIGESFAINDPSAKVRGQAIQDLSWIGATDALTRIVDALDDAGLEATLPSLIAETIPDALRPRLIVANRRLLARDTKPLDRIRRLLDGVELGDTATAVDLMSELSAIAPPLDQYADHAIGDSLKIIKTHDPAWVSTWVIAKLLEGTLSNDHWKQFILPIPQQQADDLIHQLATCELQYRAASAVRMVLSASATPALAVQIFSKLCDTQRAASVGGAQPVVWRCFDQLRDLFRAIPVDVAVAGMMQILAGEFAGDTFCAAVDVFGHVNADTDELRSSMSEPQRQALRRYLKDGISKTIADDLFDDSVRSHAATTLARIGDPEDLAELRQMIDADIQRHKTRPSATTYSNWYVRSLLRLNAADVDTVLIALLREQKYEGEAARGLLQLAVPPNRERPLLGHATDYEAIWAARAGNHPPGIDVARAKRYAAAIRQRIMELKAESAASANPQQHIGRMKDLAVLLAVLGGRESADFVIEMLTPPGQWDAYARMNGIRALLLSGAVLTLDAMLAVLAPAIEHTLSQGSYNEQNLSLLVDCLELLPFSDDPARAVARIEAVMARFQYRPFQFRDLVIAMGHARSEAAVPFLLNIARGDGSVRNLDDAWIEALVRLNIPAAREVLLSFIDPHIAGADVTIDFDHRNIERFAAYIGEWARQDPALKQRLIALSETELTPTQKKVLPGIYRELGDDGTMLAGASLLRGTMSSYGLERGLETLFLERDPYGNSGSFVFVPRDAAKVRAKLLETVLNDPTRRKAAFSILGQVEVWRTEHGRPNSEPRHPMIESGEPWPPLSVMK
ncbi:NACHT domain-containing protein [Tardiphaga sp. 367_B4_N1_1]|uniref:NACHT domain-containing protein n=1 Tax=Tardiphaga sp. 367_B4_N1_1 TaxID=3240777 RepID=UPI003F232002